MRRPATADAVRGRNELAAGHHLAASGPVTKKGLVEGGKRGGGGEGGWSFEGTLAAKWFWQTFWKAIFVGGSLRSGGREGGGYLCYVGQTRTHPFRAHMKTPSLRALAHLHGHAIRRDLHADSLKNIRRTHLGFLGKLRNTGMAGQILVSTWLALVDAKTCGPIPGVIWTHTQIDLNERSFNSVQLSKHLGQSRFHGSPNR